MRKTNEKAQGGGRKYQATANFAPDHRDEEPKKHLKSSQENRKEGSPQRASDGMFLNFHSLMNTGPAVLKIDCSDEPVNCCQAPVNLTRT